MNREIVLNLWYVRDKEGFIYSLRVKPYVVEGTDEEKIAFLKERALLDYLVAQPFEIPSEYHIRIGTNDNSETMPVTHISVLEIIEPASLFEESIKAIENGLPAQSELTIPQKLLIVLTPLIQNKFGVIEPNLLVDIELKIL